MLKEIGNERNFAWVYFDSKGEKRPCYKLDFDTTITLITGYDVKLRNAIVKEWHKLLMERAEARAYSKTIRHDFTNVLKVHGINNSYEYINITRNMKKPLGITAKKADMTEQELKKITASEYLAEAMLSTENGYHEVNPVCMIASEAIENAMTKRIAG